MSGLWNAAGDLQWEIDGNNSCRSGVGKFRADELSINAEVERLP